MGGSQIERFFECRVFTKQPDQSGLVVTGLADVNHEWLSPHSYNMSAMFG